MARKNYANQAKEVLAWFVKESEVTMGDGSAIREPQTAAAVAAMAIASEGDLSREYFGAICLSAQGKVLCAKILFSGSLNSSFAHPREVAKMALFNGASSVILFHNHPGGSIHPSAEDKTVTTAMGDALKLLDIALLDHLILAGDQVYSIKAEMAFQISL